MQGRQDIETIDTYYLQEEEKNLFEIYADGNFVGAVEIEDAFYQELEEKLQGILPDIRKDEPFIDHMWAVYFSMKISK